MLTCSIPKKQLNKRVSPSVFQERQWPSQIESQIWQCHPHGSGFRGTKNTIMKGLFHLLILFDFIFEAGSLYYVAVATLKLAV